MTKEKSTLEYISNIQWIDSSKENDTSYMKHVHDPFALEEMDQKIKNGRIKFYLTDIQKKEMKAAAGHCSFAFKEDYPWGTVEIEGEKKVVCKCINTKCSFFSQCRSGVSAFHEDELLVRNFGNKPSVLDEEGLDDAYKVGASFKEQLTGKRTETSIKDKNVDYVAKKENVDEILVETFVPITEKITEFESNKNDEIQHEEIQLKTRDNSIKQSNEDSTNELVETKTDVLSEFLEWLLDEGYTDSASKGYIKAVKSANVFARKKNIWKIDIFDSVLIPKGKNEILNMINQFEKSPFFKSSMSNYVAALKVFGQFISFYSTKENEIDSNNKEVSIEKELSIYDEGVSEDAGFDRFVVTEQETVINEEYSSRIIVNAGPGTGKTYTLIEKIIYMVNVEEVDPEEILVLCFSRAAVEVIENRLKLAAEEGRIGMIWHLIDIRTFDSFATHLLAYAVENESSLLPSNFVLDYLDYDARIEEVTRVIKKEPSLIEQCSHLIVDEVQDLVTSRAELVMQIIEALPIDSGYTLFGDACQSIYDYQCNVGEVDSIKFYKWLFKNQKRANYYSFDINYRQTSDLEQLGDRYRNSILVGDDNARNKVSNEILNQISVLNNVDLKSATLEEIEESVGEGNIGILTRTNGQALKISTWFRNSDIPHKVQKRLGDNSLNIWIADVLVDYENDTIDKDSFSDLFMEKGGFGLDVDEVWDAIEKTQREAKSRYSIEEIIHGILNNGKNKIFYTNVEKDSIVISNIHRAKGREYDNVILLDDSLFIEEGETKEINEHKVMYVGVTRAKKALYRTAMKEQYIKTDKEGERRAYATKRNFVKKKSYLTHIEVGRSYDIDPISFAENDDIQELFKDSLMVVGERITLVKNQKDSEQKGYISYDIYLEDDIGQGRIGCTSKKFYLDLKRILKEIHGLSPYVDVYPKLYPSRISDIYVDDVYSILMPYDKNAKCAHRFGKYIVMRGITLVGFGQIERDTY